jgi:large subunit ribosomal protein L13
MKPSSQKHQSHPSRAATPPDSKPLEWHVLDASKQSLGRLATQAAQLLLGKHRTDFSAHQVAPVYVIVTNSDQIVLTGNKRQQKVYRHHTGYPGHLKTRTLEDQLRRDSRWIVQQAIAGMLPKNKLRDRRLRQLKIYPTASHPHQPQLHQTSTAPTENNAEGKVPSV